MPSIAVTVVVSGNRLATAMASWKLCNGKGSQLVNGFGELWVETLSVERAYYLLGPGCVHSFTLTVLDNGGNYNSYMRCVPAAGAPQTMAFAFARLSRYSNARRVVFINRDVDSQTPRWR